VLKRYLFGAHVPSNTELIEGYSTMGPSSRLDELRSRADSLRHELYEVEAAIKAEEQRVKKAEASSEPQMHHRPSWSLLGGVEDDGLRELGPLDADFKSVLDDHPQLQIDPIGRYNHWDRRECAVANPGEWRDRCAKYMKDIGGTADIPKVIHQIWVGPKEPPCLWIDTFRVSYLEAHPEWRFEMWSDEQVAKLPMINGQIYAEEKMWQCKADILRLEFLWHHGGLYVDADMISVGMKTLDPIIEMGKTTGFVIAYEPDTKDKPYSILGNSVIACTPHHPLTLMLILFLKQTFYQKRNHEEVFAVTGPVMYTKCLVDSNMPISIAAQELLYPAFHFVPNPDAIDFSRFPKCLMFQFGYTCSGLEGYVKRKNRCMNASACPFHAKRKILDSYKKLSAASSDEIYEQVPIGLSYVRQYAKFKADKFNVSFDSGVMPVITDGEIAQLQTLRREIPGFVDRVRGQSGYQNGSGTWDVILLGIEWSTGSDEVAFFNVPSGGRPRNSLVAGMLINTEGTQKADLLRQSLLACCTERGFDPTPLFDAADKLQLWFGVQKYVGTLEESRIFRGMPVVHRVFTELAGHTPPLHYDRSELFGDRMKGWLNGQVAFEMAVESNGSITFRAWNDNNAPNCEMRANGSKVEWMKVFFNHQVVFEAQNRPLP